MDDRVLGNGHRAGLPPPGAGRRRSLVILVGLLVVLPAAYLLSVGRGEWRAAVTLEDLEAEGIVYRPGLGAFIVHIEPVPLALSAVTPGGGSRVVYCRFADAFQAADGAVFDRFGRVLAGPIDRGLDRLPVRIRVGVVEVDVGELVEGPPRAEAQGATSNLCEVPGPEEPPGFATALRTP